MSHRRLESLSVYHLRIFHTLAQEGTLAGAAELLSLSVATVSEHLKTLETLFGARLLDRSPGRRQARLTEAGSILLEACEEVFQTLDTAGGRIQALGGAETGTVKVGASPSLASILPELCESFRLLRPGVIVHAEIDPRPYILESLQHGRLDLAIMGRNHGSGLIAERLESGADVVVIGPPGHPLAGKVSVPLTQMASERWIVPEWPTFIREVLEERAAAAGIALHVAWEITSAEAIVRAVASGLGVGPVAAEVAAPYLAAGQVEVLPVEGFPVRLDRFIVHHRDPLSPAARAFKEHLLAREL